MLRPCLTLAESSRRQPTRLREKITKKASEHRRKEKKEAKKDVTWKSSASDPLTLS